MSQVDALRIYFVLSKDDADEEDCSENMKIASELVFKCGGIRQWISPSDCTNIHPQKKDVFVFDKFEGAAFEALKKNSAKILGVRCLVTCLMNGTTIPPSPHPVYMEAMRNLFVASSGFDQATKRLIQEKVQYMGGHYDNALRSIVTHLVAHNNISSKAIHSYKNNIKIMKLSWVEDVWLKNLTNDISGDDEIFQNHVSPLFHNLNVTTSGISKKEKDALKTMIESHGGHFMGTLEGNFTNVLLVTKPEGEKFKVAQNWNIVCIKPTWVQDCIEAKAILTLKPYVIEPLKAKASTPNKENCTVNFSADFTANLSMIRNPNIQSHGDIDETVSVLNPLSDFQTPKLSTQVENIRFNNTKSEKNAKSSHMNIINNVLLKNLKDAGQFLDGLNIYLYGFQSEDCEKLKRILNKGGAIRFDEMSESVTHVIAGKNYDNNLEKFSKYGAYILSIDWLVESMKLKGKANESKFLLVKNAANSCEPPSPMSKKGAQLLSEHEGNVAQKQLFRLEANDMEKLSQLDELFCRYNASQPGEPVDKPEITAAHPTHTPTASHGNNHETSSSRMSDLSGDEFFSGLTFFLSDDLSEEEIKYLEDLIIERKGQIVGKRDFGVPDFAVVPVIGALLTGITAKEVVNIYFIKDCCVEGCLLTPRYYHQPVDCLNNAKPLNNCVVSVSNYIQGEREFMEMMIEALGGVAQSLLARKPKQGALKSTHLVCAEPQGQKYEGAVRWGLPVVHHDWLLKCAALGVRVSEKSYLVGDSKMPTEPDKPAGESAFQTEMRCKSIAASLNVTGTKAPTGEPKEKMPPPPPAASEMRCLEPDITMAVSYQTTPVHSAVARVKATETPRNNNSPDPNRTVTPTSPYGAFYGKGSPTPTTRKRFWKWMNQGAEFPVDPPPKRMESDGEGTPVSELISRHLEMLKRKPEELPPDSPTGAPLKRLNFDSSETENQSKASSVDSGLKMMKLIEEKFTRNAIKSPSSLKKPTESEGRQMIVVSESQAHTEVGWGDPMEKDLVLENLEKPQQIEVEPKVFMFSCITKHLEEIKQLVEDSGGVVSSLPYFDKKATHLITGNLTRAEKLMGSIAAGLWVLHPSYVDALREKKNVHCVPEEDYEWGSPKQRFRLNLMSSNAKDYAVCSNAWRISIKEGQPHAFKDVRILLHISQSKLDSFKRLIEAGCGIVVRGQAPNYHNVEADLCVYEANNVETINFASLAKRNIPCVALVYISDKLLKVNNALEKNMLPEFQQYWKGK